MTTEKIKRPDLRLNRVVEQSDYSTPLIDFEVAYLKKGLPFWRNFSRSSQRVLPFESLGVHDLSSHKTMQTRITSHVITNNPTTLSFPPDGISILESPDPWVLSSIWRTAQERVLEQEGKREGITSPVSESHFLTEIETRHWIVLIDPLERSGTIGEFFGIIPFFISLCGTIGGWSCPECGATVCRDSVADVSEKLSKHDSGNVVCAVPREEGAPPVEELAGYFEATRVIRNGRVFLLEDDTEVRVDAIGQEWVIVSSRGLPHLRGDAESWLREQARLHPCRIDVGIVGRADPLIQWIGVVGALARCQKCGEASSPPSFREIRRLISEKNGTESLTILNRTLGEILAGTLRESAQFLAEIGASDRVGEFNDVFLDRILAEAESVLDLPLSFSLKQLPPGMFIRLAVARLRCAQLTGVQIFINQLDKSEVFKLCECDTFSSMASSIGGVVFLSRGVADSPLTIHSANVCATKVRPQICSISCDEELGTIKELELLKSGALIRLAAEQSAILDSDLLERKVAAVLRRGEDRVNVVRLCGAEILQEKGEVGHITGLYGLIAELASRIPEVRMLGLSVREVESAIRGIGDGPVIFGFPSSQLRSIPFEQLIYRIPRVGYASRSIEWIVDSGGGAVSLSEEVGQHPPGLRVIFRLIRNIPLKGRCVLIQDVGWLLSAREKRIFEMILTEELAHERGRSGGRVVWVDQHS